MLLNAGYNAAAAGLGGRILPSGKAHLVMGVVCHIKARFGGKSISSLCFAGLGRPSFRSPVYRAGDFRDEDEGMSNKLPSRCSEHRVRTPSSPWVAQARHFFRRRMSCLDRKPAANSLFNEPRTIFVSAAHRAARPGGVVLMVSGGWRRVDEIATSMQWVF